MWPFKSSPPDDQKQLLELMVKAGRRCAYDLDHASAEIGMEHPIMGSKFYHERAQYWLGVFNPGDDGKNYRARLQSEIWRLEMRVSALEEELRKHDIEVPSNFVF